MKLFMENNVQQISKVQQKLSMKMEMKWKWNVECSTCVMTRDVIMHKILTF